MLALKADIARYEKKDKEKYRFNILDEGRRLKRYMRREAA